ncbi:MAG: glycoside hydrolase family 5 protein [Oligoflexales bacterium]|nr:glycoside hydrolase family 5 protein [Oligoflexales bacterium]
MNLENGCCLEKEKVLNLYQNQERTPAKWGKEVTFRNALKWVSSPAAFLMLLTFCSPAKGLRIEDIENSGKLASVTISNKIEYPYDYLKLTLTEENNPDNRIEQRAQKGEDPNIDNLIPGNYLFELDYYINGDTKILSNSFCSKPSTKPNYKNLVPGENSITITVCQSNELPVGQDNSINGENHSTEGENIPTAINPVYSDGSEEGNSPVPPPLGNNAPQGSPVARNGMLKIVKSQLSNQLGQPIQLKGPSSHGLQWFGHFINRNSIKWLKNDWHANVIRLAMYTGEGGYLSNKNLKNKVIEGVDAAIAEGIYAIIDWHILSDNDPMSNLGQSKEFFGEMSAKYKNTPNVIYELCNEPNGGAHWSNSIKPYAEEVIRVIRGNAPNSIIIVGTAEWSQRVDEMAGSPLSNSKNVMYALHFYAGTHGAWLRDRATKAIQSGFPLFVTEWGMSTSSGNGGVFVNETKQWLDYLDSMKISWTAWSLSDKGESSALLKGGAGKDGGWSESQISDAGMYTRSRMR